MRGKKLARYSLIRLRQANRAVRRKAALHLRQLVEVSHLRSLRPNLDRSAERWRQEWDGMMSRIAGISVKLGSPEQDCC